MQSQHLKGCDIEVELYFPNNGHHELVERQASKVAMLAAELQRNCGAEFYIVLISAADAWLAPAPSVLQHLAPYLSLVNHYTIQWQIIQSSTLWFAAIDSNVTAEHILALQTATNLQSLCMATQLNNELPNFHSCLEVIASFTQLNKLQLTLPVLHVSFEPLCQLSRLEVLGLQCLDQAACCQGVLHSNRNSLHTVKLSAPTWSAATYGALGKLSALYRMDISIDTMKLAQAEELRNMHAVTFYMTVYRCDQIDIATMQMLTAVECIYSMTLWRLDDIRCEHIRCSRLKQLFIVDSPDFSGNCLRIHASVETLFMLRCCGVIAEGLYYILKTALPRLKRIELASLNLAYASMSLNTEIIDAPPLQLGADVLQALSHGQCLEKLVLLGVQGLTNTSLAILHRAFSVRQLKGQAQPRIEALASVAPEKNWTQASDWLLYPNFHPGYADDTVVVVFNKGCGPSSYNGIYLALSAASS